MYELWHAAQIGEFDFDEYRFVEDCHSLEEAKAAKKEWQRNGDAVIIKDKKTGKIVY